MNILKWWIIKVIWWINLGHFGHCWKRYSYSPPYEIMTQPMLKLRLYRDDKTKFILKDEYDKDDTSWLQIKAPFAWVEQAKHDWNRSTISWDIAIWIYLNIRALLVSGTEPVSHWTSI